MVQYLSYILLAVLCSAPTSCWAEGSGCGSVDQDLSQRRLNNLLGSIQDQLAPLMQDNETETTTLDEEDNPSNDSIRLMYDALVNSTEHVNDGSCKDGDFFAQPVTSFNVTMNIGE